MAGRWLSLTPLLLTSCVMSLGSPTRYNQSCSTPGGAAICNASAPTSTGEILIPAAGRAAQAINASVRAVEAIQGYITLQRLLTEAEVGEVEDFLKDCAKQAEADVNQVAQKREDIGPFKNGQFPNENECNRVLRLEGDEEVTLARELGRLKHTAAFDCVKARLSSRFPDNFSIEPRYRRDPDPGTSGYVLTDRKSGSLKPDFVLHFTRNATRIQCVFDFKFPCLPRRMGNPLGDPDTLQQLLSYKPLSMECQPAVVTPQLGLTRLPP
ncbi:MAG TPA: hypothetical protein VFZ09_18005 [Archangium sp.]|uniref:hypothetical protein n=1 Tax=Archangium sp. TaxID=1872627 RepID=UPI002E37DC46|nr:hypothetical protein [Archangium sp.]HEX5748139.1 hypothetical protein [Archangium sp.]